MRCIHIKIRDEQDAIRFVNKLASMDGDFYLTNRSGKECVNAKSYIGVLYFMVIHPDDTFLCAENGEIPAELVEEDIGV